MSNYIFLFQHDKWYILDIQGIYINTERNKRYTKVCCNIKHDIKASYTALHGAQYTLLIFQGQSGIL